MNRLRNQPPRLAALTVVAVAAAMSVDSAQAIERGAWFWYQSSDPHGAANIVGNAASEDAAISYLQQWEVKRLYGSYSNLPTGSAAAMAAWNKKLALAGIDSYVVFSEANHVLPPNLATLEGLVDTRFSAFNNGRGDPLERFMGIELDLEPHTLAQWDAGSNADRRDLLHDLRDAFAAVRQRMAVGGFATAPLSAALPTWFDSSSTIGWTIAAERDQWFIDLGLSLDAISLMAYETPNVSTILSTTAYERTNFAGDVHLALRSKLGDEWLTFNDFAAAMGSVEANLAAGIDIESYYRLRQIAPDTGDFDVDGDVDGADFLAWQRKVAAATGASLADGDANGDGDVDDGDLVAWRQQFGVGGDAVPAAAEIPEPAAAGMLLIGWAATGVRVRARRRAFG